MRKERIEGRSIEGEEKDGGADGFGMGRKRREVVERVEKGLKELVGNG